MGHLYLLSNTILSEENSLYEVTLLSYKIELGAVVPFSNTDK